MSGTNANKARKWIPLVAHNVHDHIQLISLLGKSNGGSPSFLSVHGLRQYERPPAESLGGWLLTCPPGPPKPFRAPSSRFTVTMSALDRTHRHGTTIDVFVVVVVLLWKAMVVAAEAGQCDMNSNVGLQMDSSA